MGIPPEIWGPHAWAFIHLMILAEKEPFDKGRLAFYESFYQSLTHLLPCEKCRLHLMENLKNIKPFKEIQSKDELFIWSIELHNLVNLSHGKKRYEIKEAQTFWNDVATGKITLENKVCQKNNYKWLSVLFVIILLIIFIRMGLRKK